MIKRTGLRTRLIRVFALQVGIISIATLIGIYIANTLIVDKVLAAGLKAEAAYFWARWQENPAASLPDTSNMRSFMAIKSDFRDVPESFRSLPPDGAVHELDGNTQLVHVSERDGYRLYLVWAKKQIYDIALFFGIVPLAIVLVIIYGLSFLAYWLSHRAVSPILQLAQRLESYDFEGDRRLALELEPVREAADAEIVALVDGLADFDQRLQAFVERERVFTRDAGHELRTPLAILRGNLDLLDLREGQPASVCNALRRMRQTITDMEALLETLLLLARGHESDIPRDKVIVNDVVAAQVEMLRNDALRAGNCIRLREEGVLRVQAADKVVEIVIGNLLRNAIGYTRDGTVEVTVSPTGVRVTDTGIGMSAEEVEQIFEPFFRADASRGETRGYGLGLSIVKRLVRQFGWSILVESSPGEGTTMEVRFGR